MPQDHAERSGLPSGLPRNAHKLLHSALSQQRSVEGRRAFYTYRDLGLTEATGGFASAQIMEARRAMDEGIGWHYHECEGQFVLMLQGTASLEFETGEVISYGAGECIYIPGYMKHTAISTSSDMKCLEMCFPANIGTVVCEPPPGAVHGRTSADASKA